MENIGLMKLCESDNGDSSWRVACECRHPDHDLELWIESDPDFGVIVNIGSTTYTKHELYDEPWYKIIWARVKIATTVLFTGSYSTYSSAILNDDGIKSLQYAIEKGVEHARNHKTNG